MKADRGHLTWRIREALEEEGYGSSFVPLKMLNHWFVEDYGSRSKVLTFVVKILDTNDSIIFKNPEELLNMLEKCVEEGLLEVGYINGDPEPYFRPFQADFSLLYSKSNVPASDRQVALDHNQQIDILEPLEEIVRLVESENAIDGETELRAMLLGRLHAGRELIRSGVFTVQSLHITLIVGLRMLVEKYREIAIGVAASKLLDLLLKQYGIG